MSDDILPDVNRALRVHCDCTCEDCTEYRTYRDEFLAYVRDVQDFRDARIYMSNLTTAGTIMVSGGLIPGGPVASWRRTP